MQFKTYFLTAWKNLGRRREANSLNILGLSIGLAGCLVIFLIERHEWSYDRYHKNTSRIHELVLNRQTSEGDHFTTSIPFEAIKALRNDYPDIPFAELFSNENAQVTIPDSGTNERKFVEGNGLFYAEPELFDLFDVKWLSGNASVLQDLNTAVLSQSLAEKYFGSWQNAIGRTIRLDNAITLRISAIIADPPANTDFPFRGLFSYKTFLANSGVYGFPNLQGWGWGVSNHQVYARLPEQMTAASFNKNLPAFIAKYYQDVPGSKKIYFLRPLTEIHFDTRFENNGDHVSSKASLYTLGFIGLLIFLMGCINFVNLSTALAVTRAKETGVRKILGSSWGQLAGQVMADTGMIVGVALCFALLITKLSLPFVHYISPIETPLTLLNKGTLLFLVAALLITTALSGIYPALQLSRFNPIEAIRNKLGTPRTGGFTLRRVLVVLQFSFSQILIVATLIAVSQMNFIRNADLGFTKEGVLLLKGKADSTFLSRERAFKQELLGRSDIQSVSFSENIPGAGNLTVNFGFDRKDADQLFAAHMKFGDADYANTYGLTMVAGHWYTRDDTTEGAVVNETMARQLGVKDPQQIVGKVIRFGGSGGRWQPIVGVVKDFKNFSLKQDVPPNFIMRADRRSALTGIRLKSQNLGRSSREIEIIWNKYYPEYAYRASFLDERINNIYRQEDRLSVSYKVYTFLAILISSLGLYGLISFLVVQKTKEVGIRKVLGASVGNIVYLFSKEFTILIAIGFAIAAPVAWFMMNGWLQDFVYRISIGAGVFLLAIVCSVGIAWITVGYKSIRAALVNPTKSLRAE